jgi:TetR/AcrR family transcriptional repressor of nem operon
MRKSRQETAETRQRIVEAASSNFLAKGIDGTGLADLMGEAGLTHGGFYRHFESKEQVVQESLALAADSLRDEMMSVLAKSPGSGGLKAIVDHYLSVEHRDNLSGGCPYVALAGELARSSEEVREITTSNLLSLIDLIAGQLPDMSPAAARKQALVVLSTMVGALSLARVVTDTKLSASILHEARKSLLR